MSLSVSLQDPNGEPASARLARIQSERQAAVQKAQAAPKILERKPHPGQEEIQRREK